MKKFLLLFLVFLFPFLFNLSNVKAESIDFVPSGMNWRTTSGVYGDSSGYDYTVDGTPFRGHNSLPVNVVKLQFGYYANKVLSYSYYDLDFILYSPHDYTDVIATFDDNICLVQKTGSLYATVSNQSGFVTSANSYYYSIHCNDYYTHDGWTNLTIYFPAPVPQESGTKPFMISKKVGANFGLKQYTATGSERSESIINSIESIESKLGATNSKLDSVKESINDTNETLNDDNTSESTDKAGEFFNGFTTNTHGLTGIITAPLTLIGNITSSSCSPLSVPLPFVNKNLSLPCMSSIYSQYFGNFYDMYKIITFGIVAYWVCVRIFNLVKDFKNPEHDEIEVMDL